MSLDQILALIGALAPLAGQQGQLVAELTAITARLLQSERERTGKTTAEILADAGVTLDQAEQKALEDLASGS